MTQSFNCPNCGAPLDYEGADLSVRCPYCNGSVIVPESLRATVAPHAPSLPVVGTDSLLEQTVELKEIVEQIRAGNKIQAIKLYRQAFKVGLAEAKDAVEQLEAGQPVAVPSPTSSAEQVNVERNLSRLLKVGNKVEAIKVYREAFPGVGAKKAQAAVEKYDSTGLLDIPDSTVSTKEASRVSTVGGSDRLVHSRAEIARLMREGKKIEAIKEYRKATGAGLKEAKDAVEAYQAGQPLVFVNNPIPEPEDAPVRKTKTSKSESGKPAGGMNGWLKFALFCIGLSLLLTLGGSFLWPNTLRVAAPFLCANGYDDAYGERINVSPTLHCYTKPDRFTTPSLPLALSALFVFYILIAAWIYMILWFIRATGRGFMLIFILPLATLLMPMAAWATGIPAPSNTNTFWLLFAQRRATTITPSLLELLVSRVTFSQATRTLAFGAEGSGPAFFTDARSVAVDGEGRIYVSEYEGARVQVFDSAGYFINEWHASGPYLYSLTANAQGQVYAINQGEIYLYDGESGELIRKIESGEETNFEELAILPDGSLVAVTDQNFVWFNSDGQVADTSEQFREILGTDLSINNLAVDQEGNLYLTSSSQYEVFIFSPHGQLLNRFGSEGDADDQFWYTPSAIAVDDQGRIYVDGASWLRMFDREGRYLGDTGIRASAYDLAFTPDKQLLMIDISTDQVVQYQLNR